MKHLFGYGKLHIQMIIPFYHNINNKILVMQRQKFVFEQEQQQEQVPQTVPKQTSTQKVPNNSSPEQKPAVVLKYNQLQEHNGVKKGPSDLAKKIQASGNYEDKLAHLEDAKRMKPNVFFREENQSPIPPENNKTQAFVPQFKSTQFDPYKYLGSSRRPKKDYQIFLDNKIKRKRNDRKTQAEQKNSQSKENINNSSQVVLDIEIKYPESVEQPEKNKIKEPLFQIHPQKSFITYSFTIQKKLGVNYFYPQYRIWSVDGENVASAKKQACHLNSFYNIYDGEMKNQRRLGFLQGNFGGTQFNIYRIYENANELLATVIYKAQLSCNAFRKMQLYVKDPNYYSQDLNENGKNLKELYESSETDKIIKIITKQPVWRQDLNSYVMNFKGKSKMSSTKNMILINTKDQSNNSLLFCKREYNKFYLQISYPLNLLISMGVLLTSFDFKLLCQ